MGRGESAFEGERERWGRLIRKKDEEEEGEGRSTIWNIEVFSSSLIWNG